MQNFIINITQENFSLLKNTEIGCFILPVSLSEKFISEFIEKAHKQRQLALLSGEGATDKYANLGADGIILDLSKEEKPQQALKDFKKANPLALVGAISRNRRHESMLISECEPDFIIFRFWQDGFAQNKELLEWYNELFLIQSAVLPEEDINFAETSADFVILDDKKYKIFVAK